MTCEGLYSSVVDKGLQPSEAHVSANTDAYTGMPELGYTDWKKELVRTAHNQNYEMGASGDSERAIFYASLGSSR